MGRAPCCDKANVKKGPWSPEEDAKLKEYIEKYGTGGNWIALPQKAGLRRCGKSCRLRWLNYLRPNIKHGEFTDEEDRIICTLFATIGSRWSIIAAQLPGRTDNDIKNYWNTKLKKKLMAMIPPMIPPLSKPQYPSSLSSLLHTSSLSSSLSDQSYITTNTNNHYRSNLQTKISSFSPTLMTTTSTSSNFHVTMPHESFNIAQMPHYQVKDHNSSLGLMYSSGGDHQQASCCSSSDGSCSNNNTEYLQPNNSSNNNLMAQISQEDYVNGSSASAQKQNEINESIETTRGGGLEYGLEEIKELISTSSGSNVLFDENKTDQGRAMMYYY